ncbi:hypothetical protein NDU88_002498 [Pleurodeles waltl]|uniref:Uncharacterized protein n=1 Tax=Pleurodeles waltl TaxID=8319 RepID=A0AAV7RC56_PLEWA|nr:hypothetical protein NDU88_002498 [Pleurodeles waltl]
MAGLCSGRAMPLTLPDRQQRALCLGAIEVSLADTRSQLSVCKAAGKAPQELSRTAGVKIGSLVRHAT